MEVVKEGGSRRRINTLQIYGPPVAFCCSWPRALRWLVGGAAAGGASEQFTPFETTARIICEIGSELGETWQALGSDQLKRLPSPPLGRTIRAHPRIKSTQTISLIVLLESLTNARRFLVYAYEILCLRKPFRIGSYIYVSEVDFCPRKSILGLNFFFLWFRFPTDPGNLCATLIIL